MHVHPPKPLHGWREFFGEVGIIVLGVLIALSAEQVVEAIHWHHVVEAETEPLDEEVNGLYGSMLARVEMQSCIDARLAELDRVFKRHASGQELGLLGPIGRPSIFTGSEVALQMATADQSLAHMPISQKRHYFGAYAAYNTFSPSAMEERATWRELKGLDHAASLTAEDWRTLRNAYDAAVDTNAAMKTNLRYDNEGQWLTPFASFPKPDEAQLRRDLHSLPYIQALCRPVLAPEKR